MKLSKMRVVLPLFCAMSATLSGLVSRTTYYVRAYATNAAGTTYGAESSFDAEGRPPVNNDNDTPELTRKR